MKHRTAMQQMYDELMAHSYTIPLSLIVKCKELIKEEENQMINFHIETMREGLIDEGGAVWNMGYVPKIKRAAEKVYNEKYGSKP